MKKLDREELIKAEVAGGCCKKKPAPKPCPTPKPAPTPSGGGGGGITP
jgi:hypothetical protein